MAGVVDGIEELPLDLMEIGVSHAETLLRNSIISDHQAGQHRPIRGLGHRSCSFQDQCGTRRTRRISAEWPAGRCRHSSSNSMDASRLVSLSRTKTTTLFRAT